MKVQVLASGSLGNVTIISTDNTKIMIDAGISLRQIYARLKVEKNDFEKLDAILITHEHTDHTKFLNSIQKQTKSEVYMNHSSFKSMHPRLKENLNIENIKSINDKKKFLVNDIEITPIALSHDSAEIFGFLLKSNDKKVCYLTDTGYLHSRYKKLIENCDMYLIESNHEPDLILMSDRPFSLKQRILSEVGHLSNEDATNILNDIVGEKTKNIVFMHLSKECNSIELAKQVHDKSLKKDIEKYYASQDVALQEIEV